MPDLTIQVQEIRGLAGTAMVALNGSIDAKTVITFQSHLNSVKERGINRFILDMENVKYVNSTGLGYLINLSDSVNSGKGGIALVKVQPKVKVVFDMLGLNAFFKIYPNREEAMKHFSSEPVASATDQTVVLDGAKPAGGSNPSTAFAPRTHVEPAEPAPRVLEKPAILSPPSSPNVAATSPSADTALECKTCRAALSLKEPGTYKCPRCFTFFNYAGAGKASFLPRRRELPMQMSLGFSEECTQGLLEFVKVMANRAGLVDGALGDLTTAVRQTVESIRDHAYAGNTNNIYHVMVMSGESELELRFADYGHAIPADKPVFQAARAAVDKFELKSHPKGGNVITLSKKAKTT